MEYNLVGSYPIRLFQLYKKPIGVLPKQKAPQINIGMLSETLSALGRRDIKACKRQGFIDIYSAARTIGKTNKTKCPKAAKSLVRWLLAIGVAPI